MAAQQKQSSERASLVDGAPLAEPETDQPTDDASDDGEEDATPTYNRWHRDRKACGRLVESALHVVGFFVLIVYAFALWQPEAFFFGDLIKDMVVREEFDFDDSFINKGYMDIGSIEEFWQWLHGPLINGLFGEQSLNLAGNALPPHPNGIKADPNYTEWWHNGNNKTFFHPFGQLLLVGGHVRMHQWRAKPNQCATTRGHAFFSSPPEVCYNGFVYESSQYPEFYDTRPYGPNNEWVYDANVGWEVGNRDSWLAESAPDGKYPRGGFAQMLNQSDVDAVRAHVDYLEANNWIDASTVSVAVDFVVFSSVLNQFVAGFMLVDFPRTGGAVPFFKIQVLAMFEYDDDCNPIRPQNTITYAVLLIIWIIVSVGVPHAIYLCRRQWGSMRRGSPVVKNNSHHFKVRWYEGGQNVEAAFPFHRVGDEPKPWTFPCAPKFCRRSPQDLETTAHQDLRDLLLELSDLGIDSSKRHVFACHEACKNSAFKAFDLNGDGQVSIMEFTKVLLKNNPELNEQEVQDIMASVDDDGDGFLSKTEFEAKRPNNIPSSAFRDTMSEIRDEQRKTLGLEPFEVVNVDDEWRNSCSWTAYWTGIDPSSQRYMFRSVPFQYKPLSAKQIAELSPEHIEVWEEGQKDPPHKWKEQRTIFRHMFGELSSDQLRAVTIVYKAWETKEKEAPREDGDGDLNLPDRHYVEQFAGIMRVAGTLRVSDSKKEERMREKATLRQMRRDIINKIAVEMGMPVAVADDYDPEVPDDLASLNASIIPVMPTVDMEDEVLAMEPMSYAQAKYEADERLGTEKLGMLFSDLWIVTDMIVLVFSAWVFDQYLDRIPLECEALKQMRSPDVEFVSLYPIVVLSQWQNFSFTFLVIAMTIRTFKFFLYFGKYFSVLEHYIRAMVATIMPTIYFLSIYLVISLGFAAAAQMLFKGDVLQYRSLQGALFMNFRALLGDVDIDLWEESDRTNARIFFVFFTAVSAIFLFNLVIGILGEAFSARSTELQKNAEEDRKRTVARRQGQASMRREDPTESSGGGFWHRTAKLRDTLSDFSEALSRSATDEVPVSSISTVATAVPGEDSDSDLEDDVEVIKRQTAEIKELLHMLEHGDHQGDKADSKLKGSSAAASLSTIGLGLSGSLASIGPSTTV